MKKMLPWLITILLAITLIVVAAFLLMNKWFSDDTGNAVNDTAQQVETKKLTADEIVAMTSEITEIKTNLADPDYIVSINFAFQLDTETAKEEFEKIKEIKIKPLIIKALADVKPQELNGAAGKDRLCSKLVNLINNTLTEGKLTQVEITNYILATI
ncbi:flagellar basal body-associated FliL family protein [Paenibacillus rhizophilus]|uniref:Flagellar protein FliL n=1 Tax=Paenibacillus rhizophilus TaxID=1850366 RepID=A0A3N9PC06_9BACL|nr:flagellar basal body-associated FliL family protein [Paenibacillus rhizophilus]RQW13135.1 flagellar basal body protein FliL [Paenibacillus rhizophilus]